MNMAPCHYVAFRQFLSCLQSSDVCILLLWIFFPFVVVCNRMSVVWIYITNSVYLFYNPLNVFLYFYYVIYIFPIKPHSLQIKRI